MQIDPALQTKADNYRLLTNLVIPRPIAWVTTQGPSGVINLAPFSFFNAVGSDPLYVVISVGHKETGEPKDTAKNIEDSGAFVVNLVTEELLPAMNVSAAEFPETESELSASKLNPAPSVRIPVPRVAEAQAALECVLHKSVPLGAYALFIGEVVMFHVADRLMGERLRVHDFAPIGRLGAPSVYCRTTDRFDVPRISYSRLKEAKAKAG